QRTSLRSTRTDLGVHVFHQLGGRRVAGGPQTRHQRRRARVKKPSHQPVKLVTGKHLVDSGVTSRQRHHFSVQLQIQQAVEVQVGIGKSQKREHRIVSSKVTVRSQVQVLCLGGRLHQVITRCPVPGQLHRI